MAASTASNIAVLPAVTTRLTWPAVHRQRHHRLLEHPVEVPDVAAVVLVVPDELAGIGTQRDRGVGVQAVVVRDALRRRGAAPAASPWCTCCRCRSRPGPAPRRSCPAVHTPPPKRSSTGAPFQLSPPGWPGRAMVWKRQSSRPVVASSADDEAATRRVLDAEAHADDQLALHDDRAAVQVQCHTLGLAVRRALLVGDDLLLPEDLARCARRARACGRRWSARTADRRRWPASSRARARPSSNSGASTRRCCHSRSPVVASSACTTAPL